MIQETPMAEIHKQYFQFVADHAGERPSTVTMHPAVWASLQNCILPLPVLSQFVPSSQWEGFTLMGMQVELDPEFPGIQILVS
jgi:hypothetical protein